MVEQVEQAKAEVTQAEVVPEGQDPLVLEPSITAEAVQPVEQAAIAHTTSEQPVETQALSQSVQQSIAPSVMTEPSSTESRLETAVTDAPKVDSAIAVN